jgi:hypothetical protein
VTVAIESNPNIFNSGQYLLNEWFDQAGGTQYTGTAATLFNGVSYPIDIWYYNNGGGSKFDLSVSINGASYTNLQTASNDYFFSTQPRSLNVAPQSTNYFGTANNSTFSFTPTISNAIGTTTWSYTTSAGSKPSWMSFNTSTGNFSGTASSAANFTATVTATDSNSNSATSSAFTVKIDAAPVSSINQWVAPVGTTGIGGTVANPGIETNTVVSVAPITVSTMSPTSGPQNTQITITFSSTPSGVTAVTFNSGLDSVNNISLTGNSLTFNLPINEQGISDQFAITLTGGVIILSPIFTGT